MKEQRIPVIIDCDPGIDDTLALMTAFAQPTLEVLAVCSVGGNVDINHTTTNARAVVATLGANCPVYRGAGTPLMPGDIIAAPEVHSATGLGNFSLPEAQLAPLQPEHAVNAQRRIIMESPQPVTLIAIGPLTNIALLLRMYPEVMPKIKGISLMGGGLYSGNRTAAAEFNIMADPEAAAIVFSSGLPLIMAGLDVTHRAWIGQPEFRQLSAVENAVGKMLHDALSFSFNRGPETQQETLRSCVHDAVSVLAVAQPAMVSGQEMHVVVETAGLYSRGYTLADLRDRSFFGDRMEAPNCTVLLEIDRDTFVSELMRCAKSYG